MATIPNRKAAPPNFLFCRYGIRLVSVLRLLWKQRTVIALIAGIVAAVFTVLQYQHQNLVDEREGKLTGQLILSAGTNGPVLNQNAPTYYFFSMPPDKQDARFAIPVHLKLTNTSNARDGQVHLVLTYERKYFRDRLPDELIRPSAARPADEQHFEKSSNGDYDYAKYRLTFLSPHDSQSFDEGAFATYIPHDPQAPTLFSSGVGLDVTARTYSERDIPRDWEIRYRGLMVQNEKDLLYIMMHWYTEEIAVAIRRKSGFWGYIPKLIFQDDVIMYGYTPDFQPIPHLNLFVPTSMPDKGYALRIKPYGLKLLFNFS